MSILCEEQAGFRKHYSTTDHIFNLKCLIDMYLRCINHCFVHLLIIVRERPFNLKGGGGGRGFMVFFKEKILIPNVAGKNILIMVEEKKII